MLDDSLYSTSPTSGPGSELCGAPLPAPPTEISLHELCDVAQEVYDLISHYVARRFRVETKADASFVTEVDVAVESFLRTRLAAMDPHAGFLGEESSMDGSSKLNPFEGAERVWVVDPIDGTSSFAASLPGYATCIALVVRSLDGALQFPVGITVLPSEGCALIALDSALFEFRFSGVCRALTPSPIADLDRYPVWLGGSDYYFADEGLPEGIPLSRIRMSGATGVDIAQVVRGRIAFSVTRAKMWDVASGIALARAGDCAVEFLNEEGLREIHLADFEVGSWFLRQPLLIAAPGLAATVARVRCRTG